MFSNGNIAAICASTAAASQPIVDACDVSPLDTFGTPVTADDVAASLRCSTGKHYELDPAPTWLIKQCSDVLSPVIASMINCSFNISTFPACDKQAMVKPLLTKPSMDPFDSDVYLQVPGMLCCPLSPQHADVHCLFTVQQSAYRVRHSTETAVVDVLNEIFRAVDSRKVCALVLLDL